MTRMAGTKGVLTSGGRTAAHLGVWSARLDGDGGSVRATLTDIDDYWLAHGRSFVLELYVGKELWRWREVVAAWAGPPSSAVEIQVLGKPERVSANPSFFESERRQKSPWMKDRIRGGSRYG